MECGVVLGARCVHRSGSIIGASQYRSAERASAALARSAIACQGYAKMAGNSALIVSVLLTLEEVTPMADFNSVRAIVLAMGVSVLSACGGGGDDSPAPAPAPDRVAPALPASPTDWIKLTPRDTLIDGVSVHPTCSNAAGTDPTYHFYARRGSGQGLMVFFGGGGACWDDASCTLPTTGPHAANPGMFFAEIANDDPSHYGGVLKRTDPASPVKDWSMVYIPSCNGDLHTGSATTTYTDPATGQPYAIEHRGADNARVVMEWIKDNFAQPSEVLALGSSAGGIGAIMHYPALRRSYPSARASLVIEAGPTLMPSVFETTYRRNWNTRFDTSVWGPQASSTPFGDLLSTLAAHYPQDRFAQYTAAADMTLIDYYQKMLSGVHSTIGAAACGEWVDGMAAQVKANQSTPNYRSYVFGGTSHSIMGWPFTATTAPVANWVGAMLSSSAAGWNNVACTDCGKAAYCPAP